MNPWDNNKFNRKWRDGVLEFVLQREFKRMAEVGVNKGNLSIRLMNSPHCEHLVLVDPYREEWRSTMGRGGNPLKNKQEYLDKLYGIAVGRLMESNRENFEKKVTFLRMPSLDAAELVPDESLDFVFIDAEHTYEACKADIRAWRPKVRPGGVLAGDDYWAKFPGCAKAILEEIGEENLNVAHGVTWWCDI